MTYIGIAHAGATYTVARGTSQGHITDGIQDIRNLGSTRAKLFVSDKYETNDYPLQSSPWSSTPTSLLAQLQMDEFKAVLDDTGLDSVWLNSWPHTGPNTGDGWKSEASNNYDTLISNEYDEIKAAVAWLLQTYDGATTPSGNPKEFVIANWEGDWALLGSTDPTDPIPPRRPDYMAGWLRARIQAVEDARRENPGYDTIVKSAVECNRVIDLYDSARHARRVVSTVLPRCSPDIVSYSAYDVLTQFGASAAAQIAQIQAELPVSLNLIAEAAPHSEIVLGELGWPENELGVGYSSNTLLSTVVDILDARSDVTGLYYWGVWDNEGTPPSNRGFFCVDTDGTTLSGAGDYINTNLGGSF